MSQLDSAAEAHPSGDVLSDFVNGRLDDQQSVTIELHLERCAVCCQTLAELSARADGFVQQLVAVASAGAGETSTVRQAPGPTVERGQWPRAGPSGPLLSTPKTIGRFEVRGQIGEGGFGVVLAAYDPKLRRDVALKVPRLGSLLTPEMSERFLREAQAAAALDHPHILPVYEAGEADGLCYIATAYCHGPNLAQWLKQRRDPVAVRMAAELVHRLALAIEHAHGRGVLHRDLKPSNVMLVASAEWQGARVGFAGPRPAHAPLVPKITDFGLAKLTSDARDVTRSDVIMGTASYMAPEQASGKARQADPRVDIYSLGAILYELLTGRPPLVGESELDTLQRVQHEEPIPPRRLRVKLPTDLETICLRCLQKDPGRRYCDARGLADDLARFLDGKPIRARPVSHAERTLRWCRRNPALAALTGLVSVLLCSLVVGSVVSAVWLREEQRATLGQLTMTRMAERQARDKKAEAEHQLFASLVAQARARRLSGHTGQRFSGMAALEQAARLAPSLGLGPDEWLGLRNEVIACLALTDLRLDRSWPGYPPGTAATGIAIDPLVERYAIVDSHGHLVVRQMEDNRELARIDLHPPLGRAPDWRLNLRFSRDGRLVAAVGGERNVYPLPTRVWNWASGQLVLSIPSTGSEGEQCDFTQDSRWFAICRADGTVANYDLLASQEPHTNRSRGGGALPARTVSATEAAGVPSCVRYDPTGELLAVCRGSTLELVDWRADRVTARVQHPAPVRLVCWSPDGQRIASTDTDGVVVIWDRHLAKRLTTWLGDRYGIVGISFNERGDQLATTAYDGTRIWEVATGTSLVIEKGAAGDFSRDGRWLSFGTIGSTVGRWEVARSDVCRSSADTMNADNYNLEINPRGDLLITGDTGRVLFWNSATGEPIEVLSLGNAMVAAAASIAPTEDYLVTYSVAGLHRWPIRNGRSVVLGPPVPIHLPVEAAPQAFRWGAGGRLLVHVGSELWIVEPESPENKAELPRIYHLGLWDSAASPDGRWIATSAWHGHQTKVWDAQSGKLVREFPGRSARVLFSPDSRHLMVSTPDGYSLFQSGSWNLVRRFERVDVPMAGPMAFSRDGHLLAIAPHGEVMLYEFPACRELASLAAPTAETIVHLCFSPDAGTIVAKTASGSLHIWDLHSLRRQLAPLGLDWDTPPYPPRSNAEPLPLMIDLGQFDDIERYTAEIAEAGDDAEPYFRRGLAYQRFRQFEQAAADLGRAIKLRSEFAAAYFARGKTHADQGELEAAIADFDQTLTLEPNHVDAWRARGHARLRSQEWRQAVDDFRHGAELRPNDWKLWFDCGTAQLRAGRLADAVDSLTKAIGLDPPPPRRAQALVLRGESQRKLGKLRESLDDLNQAWELDAEHYHRCHDLARALAVYPDKRLQDPDRAVALATRATQLWSLDPASWNTLGVALYRRGDYHRAIEALNESMRRKAGGDAFDWFILAMCHWQIGDQAPARDLYQKAVDWMQANKPDDQELGWFRAEADDLLSTTE
jgi:serine/threonine protein kinase/tetratricopeptide (TPR) repeat protein